MDPHIHAAMMEVAAALGATEVIELPPPKIYAIEQQVQSLLLKYALAKKALAFELPGIVPALKHAAAEVEAIAAAFQSAGLAVQAPDALSAAVESLASVLEAGDQNEQ